MSTPEDLEVPWPQIGVFLATLPSEARIDTTGPNRFWVRVRDADWQRHFVPQGSASLCWAAAAMTTLRYLGEDIPCPAGQGVPCACAVAARVRNTAGCEGRALEAGTADEIVKALNLWGYSATADTPNRNAWLVLWEIMNLVRVDQRESDARDLVDDIARKKPFILGVRNRGGMVGHTVVVTGISFAVIPRWADRRMYGQPEPCLACTLPDAFSVVIDSLQVLDPARGDSLRTISANPLADDVRALVRIR